MGPPRIAARSRAGRRLDAVVNLAGRADRPLAVDGELQADAGDQPDRRRREPSPRRSPAADKKPALVNASAIGYFGDRGDEDLDDDSPPGTDFLARLVQDWEAASTAAVDAGARVARIRAGIVLDRDGGILKLARIPFWLGLGGRIAGGEQWFPTVSLVDYLDVASRLVADDSMSGSFNVVAPEPATNADFTRALGRRLHRPTVIPVPGFAVRAITGSDLSVQLLGSIRAHPRRLLEAGYEFQHATVGDQLDAALA